jgi:hypothetical protein
VSYIDARIKRLWNAIPAFVLLRKNFWDGILTCSITKIPLLIVNKLLTGKNSFLRKLTHMYWTLDLLDSGFIPFNLL